MSISDFFASLLGRSDQESEKPGSKRPPARRPSKRQGQEARGSHKEGARPPAARPESNGSAPAAAAAPPAAGAASPAADLTASDRPAETPPNAVPPGGEPPSSDILGELTEDILDALGPDGTLSVAGATEDSGGGHPMGDAKDLFASIASNYFRPVQNFVFELKKGSAPKEWLEICQPVLASIIDGARSLDFPDVADRMVDFRESLEMAQGSSGSQVEGDHKELILSCYGELIAVLPDSFNPGGDDLARESIIIHSLLRQISDVGRVSLDRIYRAGLTSLDALFLANKEDLAATTGVPLWLSSRIVDRIQAYQKADRADPKEAAREHRKLLIALAQELSRVQGEFKKITETLSATPEEAETKRNCLRRRQSCLLKIDILLAEMGEVDLVEKMKRFGVERRVDELNKHVSSLTGTPAG